MYVHVSVFCLSIPPAASSSGSTCCSLPSGPQGLLGLLLLGLIGVLLLLILAFLDDLILLLVLLGAPPLLACELSHEGIEVDLCILSITKFNFYF